MNVSPASTSTPEAKASIFVVDDQAIFRRGLLQILNNEPDLVVCGEAGDVANARQELEAHLPDLVLLDMHLGASDVFELIKGWKSRFPNLRVLVLSAHDEALYAERALRAGACGFLMKNESPMEMVSAVRTALAGEMYLSRQMASRLLHKLLLRKPVVRDANVESLSDRELQVFRMLGAGLGTRKIGENLNLSIKTIETYRENIKHKLGLRNAAQLVRLATQWVQTSTQKRPGPPNEPN